MSLFGEGLELLKLVDKGRNSSLYAELGKWIERVQHLQTTNEELIQEISFLRSQLVVKTSMRRIKNHLFADNDEQEICPHCAEANFKVIHLIQVDHQKPPFQRAACPVCKLVLSHPRPYMRKELEVAESEGTRP